MKQSFSAWPLLVAALALIACQCLAVAASPSPPLEMRKVHRGTLGAACRPHHKCNAGLTCYANKCYGKMGRLLSAPCKADAWCSSGYCSQVSHRCAKRRTVGKPCWRASQCVSGACDAGTAKCVAKTTPTMASTAHITSAAGAALASATAVGNSQAFYDSSLSRPLLQLSGGQVKTVGSVKIVSTQAGPAIEMAADAQHPAGVVHQLAQPLSRRDVTTAVLSFNYVVTSFTSTTAGQCSLVPYVNDGALMPLITFKATQQSVKASYPYSGAAIASYGVGVVCDAGTSAIVDLDTIAISTDTPSSTSPASTATTTTAPSAAGTTTSASTATAVPPLPSGTCSGVADCSMESGDGPFVLPDGVQYYLNAKYHGTAGSSNYCYRDTPSLEQQAGGLDAFRTGSGAVTCEAFRKNDFAWLQSAPAVHTYTPGSGYVWTFWVKDQQRAQDYGVLSCAVWAKGGTGAVAYNGTCPLTTAATTADGFKQVAVAFNATNAEMGFMIGMSTANKKYGVTMSFDDVSVLDGQYAIAYNASQPPSVNTVGSAPQPTCSGLLSNCGFETGYSNEWTRLVYDVGGCAVTNEAADVRSGTQAYQCDITARNTGASIAGVGAGIAQTVSLSSLSTGKRYTLSFWAKSASNQGQIMCSIETPATAYFDGVVGPTSSSAAVGYKQYTVDFLVDAAETDDITIGCVGTQVDVYTFDDFDLSPSTTTDNIPANPLPSGCSGLANCNLEASIGNTLTNPVTFQALGSAGCSVVDNGHSYTDTRSASQALQCTLNGAHEVAYLTSGSFSHTTGYTAHAPMTWTFWARMDSGDVTADAGLMCSVWTGNGNSQVAFNASCPFTAAPAVNGFRQVAVPFIVPDGVDVSFQVAMAGQGTYYFDDVSMLNGNANTIDWASGSAPADSTANVGAGCGLGAFTNCGWESGYMNGLVVEQPYDSDLSFASITSRAANVHSGRKALQATVGSDHASLAVSGENIPDYLLTQGSAYVFSFWASGLTPELPATVTISKGLQQLFNGNPTAMGSIDANGYQQYTVSFTVTGGIGSGTATVNLPSTVAGVYYLDDFALTAATTS